MAATLMLGSAVGRHAGRRHAPHRGGDRRVRGDHRADHTRLEVNPFLALMIGSIGVGLATARAADKNVIGETVET